MIAHAPNPHLKFLCRSAWILLTVTVLSLSASYGVESVQFPENFRLWVHVGTGVILPGGNPQLASEEGMHHVFANPKAADGYSSGDFADGSIIVYELREAQQKNGIIFEGERKKSGCDDQGFKPLQEHGRMAIRTILG